jgi:hypothetical protein
MSYRTQRLLSLLAALAAAMVLAAGCGDDDDGDGDGGSNGGTQIGPRNTQEDTTGSEDAPDSKEDVVDRCYEQADKLEGQAKETARASCEAYDTGNTEKIEDEAKEQCLDAAKQLPDEAARKTAEESCEKIGN